MSRGLRDVYKRQAFLLPYFFVLEPRLLAMGSAVEILGVFAMAIIGIIALACVLQGYALGRLSLAMRIILAVASLSVLMPDITFKFIGIAIILATLVAWKIGQIMKSDGT